MGGSGRESRLRDRSLPACRRLQGHADVAEREGLGPTSSTESISRERSGTRRILRRVGPSGQRRGRRKVIYPCGSAWIVSIAKRLGDTRCDPDVHAGLRDSGGRRLVADSIPSGEGRLDVKNRLLDLELKRSDWLLLHGGLPRSRLGLVLGGRESDCERSDSENFIFEGAESGFGHAPFARLREYSEWLARRWIDPCRSRAIGLDEASRFWPVEESSASPSTSDPTTSTFLWIPLTHFQVPFWIRPSRFRERILRRPPGWRCSRL